MCGGVLCVLLLLLAADRSAALAPSNILLIPHPFVVSHNRLFYKLATQLIANGHNVHVLKWSATDASERLLPPVGTNVIHYVNKKYPWVEHTLDSIMWKMRERNVDYVKFMAAGLSTALTACSEYDANARLRHTLRSLNITLGIVDPHGQPCAWAIMNELGVPYVTVSPSVPIYYLEKAAAAPTPFAYVPAGNEDTQDRMTLVERAKNVFDQLLFTSSAFWWLLEALIARLYTTLHDARHNPLLLFFLSDKFIEFVRPESATMLAIGPQPRVLHPVADELSVPAGGNLSTTVVFSLTTMGGGERMPPSLVDHYANAFARFPDVRFIWRTSSPPVCASHNNTQLPSPHNIQYVKWFNQTNLFASSSTKLLISHGGIASVLEAVRHGIPILAMPLGFDHPANVGRILKQRVGTKILKSQVTADSLTQAVRHLLDDHSYASRASKISAMQTSVQLGLVADPLLWHVEHAARQRRRLGRRKAQGELLGAVTYYALDCLALLLLLAGLAVRTAV